MHFLLTDDPESRSYPGVLLAGRFRAFYTGTWNDETRTMTWNGTYAEGSNFVGVHRFIDPDHAEASGTIRDLAGRVINEVSWKQQRRREN